MSETVPAAALEAVLDALIQECENVEYGDEHEVVCADHGWHRKCAELAVAAAARLIRQATADEIAAEIEAAADAHNAKIAEIAGVPNRHRDGMVASGIREAAQIARRVGGGGGGQ